MKIALFYSFNSNHTSRIAKMIIEAIGKKAEITPIDVEEATQKEFNNFDKYIIGVPTWWDGELPTHWDEFIPTVEEDSFKGKTFAIYGAGDQKSYPDNFVDAIGIMADFFTHRGGKVIGFTPNEGFTFDQSRALRDNQFVGLPVDFINQSRSDNETRIKAWAEQILKEF